MDQDELGRRPGHAQTAGSPARYRSVEVARAVAALLVVSVHVPTIRHGLDGSPYLHGLFEFGQAGVDIFFVISGFIIADVAQRSRDAGRFAVRRLVRIVPFYWLFTAAVLLVGALKGRGAPGLEEVLASLLLLPQRDVPVLGIGWSLEHELLFYLVVAGLLRAGRNRYLPIAMATLGAAAFAWALAPAGTSGDLFHLMSPFQLQFLAGVALHRWRGGVARLPWPALLIAAALAFPATAAVLHLFHGAAVPVQPLGAPGLLRVALWGGAAAMLLCALLACEAQVPRLFATTPMRIAATLGEASFALYLSLALIFELFEMAARRWWPSSLPLTLTAPVATVMAVLLALAFYTVVERPFMERTRRAPRRRHANPPRVALRA